MKNSIQQSHLFITLLVLFFAFTVTNAYATDPPKSPEAEKEATAKKADSIAKVEKAKEVEKAKQATESIRPLPSISEPTVKTICILFFVVMLVLIILFFIQAYLKNMYLGFQSIKFIGLVIMFPGICIIALMGGNLISGSTLAALLGTIAGYVLSKEDDKNPDTNKIITDLNREKDELTTRFNDMETKYKKEISELKKG
jgi:hypothetical protein